MALTIQVCGQCKHEHGATPSIVIDGLVYNILCPCLCHARMKNW